MAGATRVNPWLKEQPELRDCWCDVAAHGGVMAGMSSGFAVPSGGLLGQTVVITGGSSGIGFATARRAKDAGARLIITDRRAGSLDEAADEIGAEATAVFDAEDPVQLEAFLARLPMPVDHVLLGVHAHYDAPLGELDLVRARDALAHLLLPFHLARFAIHGMRADGSLVFIGGGAGRALAAATAAALPALIADLALETAPLRVNLIAVASADALPSPVEEAVGLDDIALLAVHLMTNTALTGATYDLGGGQALTSTRRTS
jgi:NAD(P)-dependent dehydrogenase (short-subunit alcohol dehydrogenase family)